MAHELVTLLGYSYTSQAVISPRLVLPSLEHIERDLDGAPGTRAPHLWVSQQGQRISLLDLFHTHFVLLAGEDGEEWCQAAHKVASTLGLRLRAYRVGRRTADLIEEDQPWHALYGVSSAGAVLVRPDGHVAWHRSGNDIAGHCEHELKRVFLSLLG
jgi:putative polyketide hydroxylase